jgi:adenosylhomocysteinase
MILKSLETFYGTGDGFIRSFVQHSKSSLKDKAVLLFGYEKVGSGVTNAFLAYTKNITVVDISAISLQKGRNRNIKALSFDQKAEIIKAISNADIVVTATGVKNIISNTFEHDLFKGKFLANVGVADEYGYAFEKNEILGGKMPLNFLLDEPTKMRYLDPSFYAHNLGCELIMQRNLAPGYHPFPPDVDIAIIKEWQGIFKEDLSLLGLSFLDAA